MVPICKKEGSSLKMMLSLTMTEDRKPCLVCLEDSVVVEEQREDSASRGDS